MPLWILLAIASGIASNLFNFSSRHYLKEGEDSTPFAWLLEVFRVAISLLFLPFNFFLILNTQSLIAFFLLGISEVCSIYFIMKMHSYSHLSISTIISRTRLIWVAALSYLVFGETLTLIQFLAIMVLLLGISIVSSPKKVTADKGVIYAYLSAFFAAMVAITIKSASSYTFLPGIVVIMGIFPIIIFPLLMKNSIKRISTATKTLSFSAVFPFTTNILSIYGYAWALSLGPASIVAALYQGMMIIAVIGGIVFLNEKQDIGKKIIGSTLALGAILLLTLN